MNDIGCTFLNQKSRTGNARDIGREADQVAGRVLREAVRGARQTQHGSKRSTEVSVIGEIQIDGGTCENPSVRVPRSPKGTEAALSGPQLSNSECVGLHNP